MRSTWTIYFSLKNSQIFFSSDSWASLSAAATEFTPTVRNGMHYTLWVWVWTIYSLYKIQTWIAISWRKNCSKPIIIIIMKSRSRALSMAISYRRMREEHPSAQQTYMKTKWFGGEIMYARDQALLSLGTLERPTWRKQSPKCWMRRSEHGVTGAWCFCVTLKRKRIIFEINRYIRNGVEMC